MDRRAIMESLYLNGKKPVSSRPGIALLSVCGSRWPGALSGRVGE